MASCWRPAGMIGRSACGTCRRRDMGGSACAVLGPSAMLKKDYSFREAAMPLLDHFRPPLRRNPHFESVNHTWATCIAQHLNASILPPRYRAQPETTLGINLEADVATFAGEEKSQSGNGNG